MLSAETISQRYALKSIRNLSLPVDRLKARGLKVLVETKVARTEFSQFHAFNPELGGKDLSVHSRQMPCLFFCSNEKLKTLSVQFEERIRELRKGRIALGVQMLISASRLVVMEQSYTSQPSSQRINPCHQWRPLPWAL